jgi:hypothetical protein
MGRDHRSQAEKACIGWNHVWMEETDTQGTRGLGREGWQHHLQMQVV